MAKLPAHLSYAPSPNRQAMTPTGESGREQGAQAAAENLPLEPWTCYKALCQHCVS